MYKLPNKSKSDGTSTFSERIKIDDHSSMILKREIAPIETETGDKAKIFLEIDINTDLYEQDLDYGEPDTLPSGFKLGKIIWASGEEPTFTPGDMFYYNWILHALKAGIDTDKEIMLSQSVIVNIPLDDNKATTRHSIYAVDTDTEHREIMFSAISESSICIMDPAMVDVQMKFYSTEPEHIADRLGTYDLYRCLAEASVNDMDISQIRFMDIPDIQMFQNVMYVKGAYQDDCNLYFGVGLVDGKEAITFQFSDTGNFSTDIEAE
jgi:hypothetical protein